MVDWRPREKIPKMKLRRHQHAIGNPAYPP